MQNTSDVLGEMKWTWDILLLFLNQWLRIKQGFDKFQNPAWKNSLMDSPMAHFSAHSFKTWRE